MDRCLTTTHITPLKSIWIQNSIRTWKYRICISWSEFHTYCFSFYNLQLIRNFSGLVFTIMLPVSHEQSRANHRTVKMAKGFSFSFFFVLLVLTLLFPGVHAFDAGDAIALVLGLIIGVLGICACLGYYARKRAGWKTRDTSSYWLKHYINFMFI